jgi:hypothetical protein
MVEKSKPLTSNITMKECMALNSLKDNKAIRILQADKGNCEVVMNESTYKYEADSKSKVSKVLGTSSCGCGKPCCIRCFPHSPHYLQACAHVARMLSFATVAVRNGAPDYYNREV